MKTIAFVTQKGGSGKSTLCIGLAVAAAQTGASVCILDMDRQASIADWATLRTSPAPNVARADSTELGVLLTRLAGGGCHYTFIDTPGAIGPETLAAIRVADLCLVPSRPTSTDLRAMRPTLAAIYRQEKPFAFVLNQTPPQLHRVHDAADRLVGLGVLPEVNIGLRNDHQDALGRGQGVSEFAPAGKAAEEINALWRWTARRLDLCRPRQSQIAEPEETHVRAA